MIETIILGTIWYQIIAIFGLSIGLHRYFTHRQNFNLSPIWESIILYLIVLTGAKSPLGWAAAHRTHHNHSDTELDPHSPKHKGFWYVLLNKWMFEYPNIKRSQVKDLLENPRVMFFHRHYNKIHLISALISILISFKFFIGFIVMPFILSYIFYGLFYTLGHKDGKPVTSHIINLFAAGEGYHDIHHDNWKKIRLGKWDLSGLIIEKVFK